MINALRFLRDYRIPYADGGVTRRPDWVHVNCPFCPGAPDFHLGWHLGGKYSGWKCWRCGGHSWEEIARALAGLSFPELLARYGDGRPIKGTAGPKAVVPRDRKEAVKPIGAEEPLGPRHRAYLEGRRFDPDALEREWGLYGTGLVGPDKLRIVAPVLWEGRAVTWQARDVTGKAKAKYRACPPEAEARPIKACLYGLEKVDPERGCAVVEGITDVWRLGPGAVATFGTEWAVAQARLLLPFRRVFLLFDSGEEAAQRFSERLCALLLAGGVPSVETLDLGEGGDPGGLPQDDANRYMKELGLR